jgi:cell division protein FtsL
MIQDNPTFRLALWLLAWPQLLHGLLLLAVVVSCFGVSYAAFQTRQNYSRLQVLVSDGDSLDSEYEKLLLEQSAWAGYARIDELSRDDLDMRIPEGKQVVVVPR